MKQYTIAVFDSRERAETAINALHTELKIGTDEISYIYQNTEGEVHEVDSGEVSDTTPGEGAQQGAAIGGALGAIAGIATVAGVIPVIGPIFAAGPLVATLGIGAGALGTTVAGGLTGAAAGGLIGALAAWGVSEEKAQEYEDYVVGGNVLVAVHADNTIDVATLLTKCDAVEVATYPLV